MRVRLKIEKGKRVTNLFIFMQSCNSMLRRTLYILLLLLSGSAVWAQVGLRIELANGPVIPSSADTGTSFSFNVKVINDSASTFQGSIGFNYSINGTTYTSADSASGINYTTESDTLAGGDSVVKMITVIVKNPKFTVGPSVVVIWPVAFNADNVNTLGFNLNVTTSDGMPIDDDRLGMYINYGHLYINNPTGLLLNRVRIYDLNGRLIQEEGYPYDGVPVSEYAAGFYIAELTYVNGKRKTFRFMCN